jgi:hypothetical protein
VGAVEDAPVAVGEPAGEELGHVASALESGAALRASPLLAGTGPMLEDLRVDRLESRGAQDWGRAALARVMAMLPEGMRISPPQAL